MALNPFARRRPDGEVGPADAAVPTPGAGEPTPEREPSSSKAPASRSRRGTRGGRRSRTTTAKAAADGDSASSQPEPAESAPPQEAGRPAARRTSRPSGRRKTQATEESRSETETETKAEPRARRTSRSTAKSTEPDLAALAKAIEQQAHELEALRKAIAEQREGSLAAARASEQRVGVFVDAANAEKAREERRVSVDWRKILAHLVAGRRIARAVAYAPISDDPAVSIETQRFVEPFLDCGYRVVTKPLKRFQGGAIKANLDIEIALDVMQMIDRLDVVCLVSGDGDFEPLVETVQARGVRVEVASFPHNTAANLRHAADEFVDLSRLKT